MTSTRKRIVFMTVALVLPIVALLLMEGAASFAFFGRTLIWRIAETRHTERDTLLGWVNLREVSRPDLYGPGASLRTNAQRFRHHGEVGPTPPVGSRRVICSGDSFTLGYGVNDRETWCAQLATMDGALETINMGQGGYGIDQAYLWYLRDGIGLRPDIHLFAFVTWDFARMTANQFSGYPKPLLSRNGDSIRVTNVPVPRPGFRPAVAALARAVRGLQTFRIFDHYLGSPDTVVNADSLTWELARAALRDLARRDSAVGAQLIVVHLPTAEDYNSGASSDYRRWAHAAAARNEFALVDLVEAFRRVPPDSIASLFRPGDVHYSAAGNEWVARELRETVFARTVAGVKLPNQARGPKR